MGSLQQTLSDVLGYTSIAMWLGAQFPQVLENIRQKSCEGLALPFLANWLLGDVSNLIGCFLTHQLPFQTYLAIYFVFVDCMLVGQYIYYTGLRPPSHARRTSIDRTASRYRTLSSVAANVAAAAALAAQQDGSVQRHGSSSRISRDTQDDEIDEASYASMMDSFRSERPGRKRVSWSTERRNQRGASVGRTAGIIPSLSMHPTTDRGRSLQRDVDQAVDELPSIHPRRASKASRRGASMVFLGVFAIFGLGGRYSSSLPTSLQHVGKVLATRSLPDPYPVSPSVSEDIVDVTIRGVYTITEVSILQINERVIGRIFAWLCTTLYLTSRLPQIWKNYVRKSVEGLSMFLFIFAFLGNVFYVASILCSPNMSSPPPESTKFIRESIPYLLGSGGTLMFDVTIVTQSFIYRPRLRKHISRSEEGRPLLPEDGNHQRYSSSTESVPRQRGRASSIIRT